MVLQGEGYFLMNAGMDLVCLVAAGRYLGLSLRPRRAAAAAVLGGLYSLAAVMWPSLGGLSGLLCASFLLSVAAFPRRQVLQGTAGLWLVGLCAYGMASIAGRLLPWDGAVLCASGIFALSFCLMPPRGARQPMRGVMHVVWQGKEAYFPAMVDTGNLLVDAVTGLPAVVAGSEMCTAFFADGQETLLPGMRLIRAQGVHGSGVLVCFRPDAMVVRFPGCAPVQVQAVLAVTRAPLPCALLPGMLAPSDGILRRMNHAG